MPFIADAPEEPKKKSRFTPDVSDSIAPQLGTEPVYDPMGVATGMTQAAAPGPSKEVREFERREGPFGYAKEYAKGTAGLFVGGVPELVNIPSTITSLTSAGLEKLRQKAIEKNLESGTPSALKKNEELKNLDLQKFVIPRIPYGVPEMTEKMFGKPTSNIAAGMRTAGEVLGAPGIPSAVSVLSKTARIASLPFKAGKEFIQKSIGRDVTAAEEAAINKARQIAEGKAAQLTAEETSLLKSLEQETARIESTTKAAEKAEAGEAAAVRGLAGTRTAEEFGRFTTIPQTKQEVGNYLRGIYENFVDSVKKVRSQKANEELKGSLNNAAAKEASGQAFKDSEGMKDLLSFIQDKLSKETDPALRSQLTVIKKALFGGEKGAFSAEEIAVEMARQPSSFSNEAKRRMAIQVLERKELEQGVVPSFQSSETIRRKIGDAAFGVPEQGYAAIGQNLARDLYGKLSNSMKSFEPSFADYLERYKRLSETIEASGTKLGKSLGAVEKDAKAYYATDASSLPDRAFRSGESVQTLIDALGGNKQPVMAAAERWAAGKIAEAGNAEKARKFLTSDTMRQIRSVLGPEFDQRITQKYLQEATALSEQAKKLRATIDASQTIISDATKNLEKIGGQKTTIESGIKAVESALNETDRQRAIANLVTKLGTEIPAGQAQELNVLVQGIKDALDERSKARWLVAKGAGLVGAGGLYGYFGR